MPESNTTVPIGWDSTVAASQYGNLSAPEKWDFHSQVGVYEKDTFKVLEGSSKDAFVVTKQDLTGGDGFVVNMRTSTGFYQEGVMGSDTFQTNAQFEKRRYGEFSVVIGAHRHGSASNEALEAEYALDLEVGDGTALEEGRWMGRRMFENCAMTIRERCSASSRRWCGNRTLETLRTQDTLDRQEVITTHGAFKTNGGGRANVADEETRQIMMRTVCIAPSVVMTKLRLDPQYMKMVEQATARGTDNYVFRGDVVDFDNCVFHEHDSLIHDGDGPLGSVFSPVGQLGEAISAADTVPTVKFGLMNPEVYYAKWFPGYNYRFQKTDTMAVPDARANQYLPTFIHGAGAATPNIATGGEHYLMLLNQSTGEVGYLAYDVGNDGKQIVCTRRLSATNGTVQKQTLPSTTSLGYVQNGNLGQNVAVWGNGYYGTNNVKLIEAFPVGCLIFPCNSKGVPFGWAPFLGAGAVYRAYGKYKCKRGYEKEEDGFVSKGFTRGYFGHRCRCDMLGRTPGIMLVGCAINDPAFVTPTVPV